MTYTDGSFIAPLELEGSGLRRFDEVSTQAFTVVRNYIQSAAYYKPLPISTRDAVYANAYLVAEQESQRIGGYVWFSREYYCPPGSRTESRLTSFTFPGRSSVSITWEADPNQNNVGAKVPVQRWNKYGAASPCTKIVVARTEITYTVGEPSLPKPTLITYDGAPVDFVGFVYEDGKNGIELKGSTSPFNMPSEFILSSEASRVRGDIWRREVVTLSSW